MTRLTKRSTIYFDPQIYQALQLKASLNQSRVSWIVDEAVNLLLSQDELDLAAIHARMDEDEIGHQEMLDRLI